MPFPTSLLLNLFKGRAEKVVVSKAKAFWGDEKGLFGSEAQPLQRASADTHQLAPALSSKHHSLLCVGIQMGSRTKSSPENTHCAYRRTPKRQFHITASWDCSRVAGTGCLLTEASLLPAGVYPCSSIYNSSFSLSTFPTRIEGFNTNPSPASLRYSLLSTGRENLEPRKRKEKTGRKWPLLPNMSFQRVRVRRSLQGCALWGSARPALVLSRTHWAARGTRPTLCDRVQYHRAQAPNSPTTAAIVTITEAGLTLLSSQWQASGGNGGWLIR